MKNTIGFLGYGNMGEAILRGLVAAKMISANSCIAYDLSDERLAAIRAIGGRTAPSPGELAASSDVLILATKPQDMAGALDALNGHLSDSCLVISIAAGISIALIQDRLGSTTHVARVMPNTPALVGAGAAGVALSDNCEEADAELALNIFRAVGLAERVSESQIDAVTALSGSGPAYCFYFVECMVASGMELGLSEQHATTLATQTMYGAAKMLLETSDSAAVLRERVTSKGGTTFAALETLQNGGFEALVSRAMLAAAERSQELGQ